MHQLLSVGKHPQLGLGLPPQPPPPPRHRLRAALASLLARHVDSCQKVNKEIALLFLGPDSALASTAGTGKASPKAATGFGRWPLVPRTFLCWEAPGAASPRGAEFWEAVEESCASLDGCCGWEMIREGGEGGKKKKSKNGIKIRFKEVGALEPIPGDARVSASSSGVRAMPRSLRSEH